MNCIICNKQVTHTAAASCFGGVYCKACATARGFTPEQVEADERAAYLPPLYKTEEDEAPRLKPEWAKDNPFLKVQLRPGEMKQLDREGNTIYQLTEKIRTDLVDKEDEAMVQAIIKYAEEQGFTKLCLIDKKFIHEAIKKQIQTKPIAEADDFGDRSLCCPNCLGPVTNYWAPGTKPKHCQFCGQALKWEG